MCNVNMNHIITSIVLRRKLLLCIATFKRFQSLVFLPFFEIYYFHIIIFNNTKNCFNFYQPLSALKLINLLFVMKICSNCKIIIFFVFKKKKAFYLFFKVRVKLFFETRKKSLKFYYHLKYEKLLFLTLACLHKNTYYIQ